MNPRPGAAWPHHPTHPPTLRSCMRQLMMPRKLPVASVARVPLEAMYSSYSWRWRLDSLGVGHTGK